MSLTSYSDLHEKLKSIRPDHEVNPGNAFVAILQHTIDRAHQWEQDAALWIKCPKDKEVSSLAKAYRRRCCDDGEEVVLRHDFQVLDEKTILGTLATRDPYNFIALEAVRTRDLVKRKTATPARSPLAELTNTPTRFTARSSTTPKDSGIDVFLAEPSSRIAGRSTPTDSSLEQIGWEDFYFEDQEPYRRGLIPGHANSAQYAQDKECRDKWMALTEDEKQWYKERGSRLRASMHTTSPLERRVWHWAF